MEKFLHILLIVHAAISRIGCSERDVVHEWSILVLLVAHSVLKLLIQTAPWDVAVADDQFKTLVAIVHSRFRLLSIVCTVLLLFK